MPLLAPASATAISGALPIVGVIALSGIVALCIAAWVVRDVARFALQRSAEDDIPRVLVALGGWLEQLRLFLPWQGSGQASIPRDDHAVGHTDRNRDLSKGGSQ
jgi:hypothetical protein